MKTLDELFKNNREWAEGILRQDPDFFTKLSRQQSPTYLWIGCADSRVPANQIVGLLPGDIFVHRNIANMVVHTDLNCLSVMQFAVDILKVKHVLVVGHYGCSGVQAAMRRARVGLADNWLRHVQDVHEKHQHTLKTCASENARVGPAVRAQRHRTGAERLPDQHRARCLGTRPGVARARMDLRHRRWAGARSWHHGLGFPRSRAGLPGGASRNCEPQRQANYLTTLSCGRRLPSSGGAGLVGGSGPRSCSENTMPSPVSRA